MQLINVNAWKLQIRILTKIKTSEIGLYPVMNVYLIFLLQTDTLKSEENQIYERKNLHPTIKHRGSCVMVWG